MKFSYFDIDPTAAEDGVWRRVGLGARVKVAKAGNRRYMERLATMMLPYEAVIGAGKFEGEEYEKIAEEIQLDCEANTILLDWDGFESEDGEPLSYSVEMAKKVLRNYPELRLTVASIANNIANYQRQAQEAAEKN